MTSIFYIDMLPAREGDCLWIEYGNADDPHRLLIDGGRQSAYDVVKARFAALPEAQRAFELAILTHVDADHIEGFLAMLEDRERGVEFRDFWFNGFHHLEREAPLIIGGDMEAFGAVQGETLTRELVEQKWPWNVAFAGGSVVVPDQGQALPTISLVGGLQLTILSPTWNGLEKMQPRWEREVKKAGLVPGAPLFEELAEVEDLEAFGPIDADEVQELAELPFQKDRSAANGSSIAVLAEFEGKRALLTGDAHADVLVQSLARLPDISDDGVLDVDVFKVSHHGSQGTLSNELVQMVNCHTYLISTDGSRHHHPDREAIARILRHGAAGKRIIFNYRSEENVVWEDDALQSEFAYTTRYPEPEHDGEMRVELLKSAPPSLRRSAS